MRSVITLLVFAVFLSLSKAQTGTLTLTVAYCPTEFTGKGAIVQVDPTSGDFTITSKFDWPSDIIGCPALEDPIVTFDDESGDLYMFFDDENLIVVVDVNEGDVISSSTPDEYNFTGYENMAWSNQISALEGLSGTVTENGFCWDGCFQYGSLTTDGTYTPGKNIPFKAVMDDSHFLDESSNTYWVQASYDLRAQTCAPADSDLCLLSLDSTTGSLKNAVWTNWTIYKYGPSLDSGSMIAWMEGFDDLCQHPYDDFLFAKVDLATATATPIACIPTDVTIQMDEWISSFSLDSTLFATGSGDQYTGMSQLLVFDTSNGDLVLNSTLSDLPEQLHSADNFVFIWSVDWV